MSNRDDLLLFVIAAQPAISWQAFKRAFDTLYARYEANAPREFGPINRRRNQSLKILEMLGHCDAEFERGDGKIYVAPPVLARLPHRGLPQAVLCGARGPQSISKLKLKAQAFRRQVKVEIQAQQSLASFAPCRIVVEAESAEMLSELAKNLNIGYLDTPPSWQMLHGSGSLQEYLEVCNWSQSEELNWARRDFDAAQLQFKAGLEYGRELRLSRYDNRAGFARLHILWNGNAGAQVDLNWGRYAVLRAENTRLLAYDPRRFVFAVPSSAPLPRLFARVLALCSGYAPQFVGRARLAIESPERYGFDTFSLVPPDVASLLASKLGQTLVECNLDN